MPETIIKGILGVILLLCSIQDTFQKKVYSWLIVIGAVLICICIPFSNSTSLMDRFGGVMVGASVIIISKATGGKIGMGDGFLLCVTGMVLGLWGNLELFAYALFAAAIVSIILLSFKLVNQKKSIPFIPFILLSYLFITAIPAL